MQLFCKKLSLWFCSALLALATTLCVYPAEVANASGQQQYFTFTNVSTLQSNPSTVNASTITVSATFNGVVASSITYTVTQVLGNTTGQVASGTGQTPVVSGNLVTFSGVQLFPGLNRIDFIGYNASNQQELNSAWVDYVNSPTISNVQTSQGTALTAAGTIVNSSPLTITFSAPNTTSATVNGATAYNTGGSQYVLSNINLQPGDNPLTIVASNSTQTFSSTVDAVYFNQSPTPYGLTLGGSSNSITPSNDPTFENLSGSTLPLAGSLAMSHSSTPAAPTVSAYIDDATTAVTLSVTAATTGNSSLPDTYTITGSVNSPSSIQNQLSGSHKLTIVVTQTDGTQTSTSYNFQYANPATPHFIGINQLYGVQGPIAGGTGTSSAVQAVPVTGPLTVTQLPVYLDANISGSPDPTKLTLTTTTGGGSPVALPPPSYKAYTMADGTIGVALTQLPVGSFTLTFNYDTGSGIISDSITIVSSLLPSIQLTNIADGETFYDSSQVPAITGKLLNFDWPSYVDPAGVGVQVTINGQPDVLGGTTNSVPSGGAHGTVNADGTFTYPSGTGLSLFPGANHISFSATDGGHVVTTSITVYYLSTAVPAISNLTPLPVGSNSDPNHLFSQIGTGQYGTTQSSADITGEATLVDQITVNIGGTVYTTFYDDAEKPATLPANYTSVTSGGTTWYYDSTLASLSVDAQTGKVTFRLTNLQLQSSGTTNITIQGVNVNGNQIAGTLSISKTVTPYTIVSPNLANGGLINSNFLPVIIEADSATSVTINKLPAQPIGNNEYALELESLKPGQTTVKFSVVRGSSTTSGSFTVTYANQSTVGAQYKAQLPPSGTLSVLGGAVQLKFPKNTVMEPANPTPGQQEGNYGLDANRYILAGIADERTGALAQPAGVAFPQIPPGFVPAGNVYWLDAGYPSQTAINAYTPVGGYDPNGDPTATSGQYPAYVSRGTYGWMQPTNDGSITLQYDPNIRNAAQTRLTVFYLDPTTDTWTNLGGVVNASNHTITVPFRDFGYYTVSEGATDYQDVLGHPYARVALSTMYDKGIMLPVSANSFGVYQNITRAEFAEMLVKILNLPLAYDTSHPSFDDVPPQIVPGALWDYRYIETAARSGVIHGIGPRLFAPNDSLTREQAAVMIATAANFKLALDPSSAVTALQSVFTDASNTDYYAAPSVLAVYKAGIINGIPANANAKKTTYAFDPTAPLTRADAAIIAMKTMQKLNLLPTST